MRALKRIMDGRVHYFVDTAHPEQVQNRLLQASQWFPEHQAEIVEVEIKEVGRAVDPKSEGGAAILGVRARAPRDGEAVMANGTVSAPDWTVEE